MRPWISLLVVGACLAAASALPTAANDMMSRSTGVARVGQAQAAPLRHGLFLHDHSRQTPFAFGAPVFFPGAFVDGDVQPRIIAGLPPLGAPPAAVPRLSAAEERPSVETTADGMVIVRGPGSRHVGR